MSKKQVGVTVTRMNPKGLSQKLCHLSERHKGFLALLVTVIAAMCVVICGLILVAFGTSSVAAYHYSLGFVQTTCKVIVSISTGDSRY